MPSLARLEWMPSLMVWGWHSLREHTQRGLLMRWRPCGVSAQPAVDARRRECGLREEVHALNARIEALDLASSCAKRGLVDAKRKEADAVKIGLATKQDLARHKAEAEALRKQLAESAAALEKAQREGETAANAAKAAMAAPKQDLSMLDIMEQQLVKLSQLVNTKEEEIESLKLTVEKECQERGFLVAELNMLRKKAAR